MKTSKKILGVLLALAMLVNVFAVFSFAAAPDSAVDLTLTPDKASYSAGDVVTFTISEKVIAAVGAMRIGGQYAIGYNSAVIEALSTSDKTMSAHGVVALQGGYDEANSGVLFTTDCVDALGDAIDTGYDWNSIVCFSVVDDLETTFDATSGADVLSFQMKLSDTVADGDYVVGFNVGSYVNCTGYANDHANGGIYGYTDDDPADGVYDYGTTANYGFVNATIHVGAPASASILNPFKSQIRFDKNGDGTYAGTFDVRQLAVVSKADFEAKFGATVEAQKAAIAEVGFVFARTSTVATFDVAAAKALIENGTAAAGYTKKTVDYITTNAGVVGADNYGFSCIVEDIPTADNADGMYALAYIKGVDGTFHYYPAAEPTSFNDLYTAHYNSAFPA